MRIVTNSAQETEQLGERLAAGLKGGQVLALFGPMGMGKTAFTRGLARGLGASGEVSSPTFALVHEHSGKIPLYHFDMFRVDSWDDLYSTGFFDYLESGGVLVIEWSENIEGALPEDAVRITISQGEGENQRVFQVEGLED
mgnify:CR=1 FL=1